MKTLFILILLLASGIVSAQDIPSSGLRVHLKADAGTSTTFDGVAITQWNDQSGNGFHATAPGGQPVYQSNVINGQPALFFNGAQYLHIANTSALGLVNSDYEMFFVAKSSNSGIQFLGAGSLGHHEVHYNGLGGLRFIANDDAGINHGTNLAYTDGNPRILSVRATGANGLARVDGLDVGNSLNSRSSSDAMFRLGDRSVGGYPLIGHIAEVIIYNRVLSKLERYQVETYLAQKYGVANATANAPTLTLDSYSTSQLQGVTFSGSVNPNGTATTYRFLYGTDENNLTLSTEPKTVGSGTSAVAVSASIPGLSLSQTYYVALVAENAAHGARTSTQEFTILGQPTEPATASIPAIGLRLHLKADAGTSTTVENQAVNQWLDQSGNGFTATAPAGQPVYVSSSINGLPALQFNGAQVLHISNTGSIGLTNNDYEMFFVAKSSNSNIQFLASGGLPEHEVHLNGASGMRFIPRNSVFIDNGANQAYTDGLQRIFSVRASSTTGVSRLNGVDASQATDSRSSVDAMFRLGMRSDGSYPLVGHISEVLLYNRTLTTQERAQVENYLAQKYAVDSDNLTLPTASIDMPTTTQDLTANFTGTVNPNGVATSVRFAYGTDPENLNLLTDPVSIGSGTEDVDVSAMVSGLSRFETYSVKLIASTDFQTVETGLLSFDTSYLEVISFGWIIGADSENPQETLLSASFQLGVPDATGSEYKIRLGSYETEYTSADHLSGTFFQTVWLPNEDLVYGQTYELVLIGKSPNGKLTYSDTLSALYYGQPSVVLTSATASPDGTVEVVGSVNPNGAATSYSIWYGTDLQSLTETALVSVGNGTSPVSIDRTFESLTPGQNYHIYLYAENDRFTVESDTLTFTTKWASASMVDVTSTRESGATFSGLVNPNGFETEFRFRFGADSTAWTSAGFGSIEIPVEVADIQVPNNATYDVFLEARIGVNIIQSDTLTFDTYYVELRNVALSLGSQDGVLGIIVSGIVDAFGNEDAIYVLRFGSDPEDLSLIGESQSAPYELSRFIDYEGALIPGNTYYAQVEAIGATDRSVTSPLESIRFAGLPIAVLDSVTTSQSLTARFDGSINPNAGNVSYVVQFGTDRNNLNQTSAVQTVENTGLNPVAEWTTVENLTPGVVYYATIAVTNGNYPTQRSDTLEVDMRYATVVYFNPDVENPTDVRFYMGSNPHGSFKIGQVNYGASTDHLNRSIIDSTQYSGTNMVTRTLLVNDLSPDSTYYAQWVITDLTGGPTTYSEVVEFNTIFPTITIDSVLAVGYPVLNAYATVNTKNQDITIRGEYASPGGSFSTQDSRYTISVSGSNTPVNVVIPMTELDEDEEFAIRLRVTNSSNKTTYSDTVDVDTYFVDYYQPTVSYSGADVAIRVELEAQPNLAYAYRILRGTRSDSLTATGEFVTMNTSNRYTDIEAILDASSFTPGTTYYFTIEGRGTSGWITRSDTLSFLYQSPPYATTPQVDAFQNYSANLSATVYPNGRAISYWIMRGTHPDSLSIFGDATDVAASSDSVLVDLQMAGLTPFNDYYVSIAVQQQGQSSIARTDTVTFDTKFADIYVLDVLNEVDEESDGWPIMGRFSAYVSNNRLEGTAWVVYGTHPDSLIHSTDAIELETDSEYDELYLDIPFGPLDANKTYYATMVVENDFRQSVSSIQQTITNYPGIRVTSVNAAYGQVYILGNIQPNGFDGVYGMKYGTHPDSLNTTYNERTFNSNSQPFDAGFELYNLDQSNTYYAYLYARSYGGKIGRTATFNWDYIYPAVDSSRVVSTQDLTASVEATIDTKGMNLDFWVEVYNGVDGWNRSDTLRVTASETPVDVSVPIGTFERFVDATFVLALKADGKPVAYADTTTFSLDYPEIVGVDDANTYITDNQVTGVVEVRNPGRPTTITTRYGYANHPDSLIYTRTDFTYPAQADLSYLSFFMDGINRNDSIYYQVAASNPGFISWSPIWSVYTIGHQFTLDTPILTPTSGGTFRADVTVLLDPKGMSTSIREEIATMPDFSDATSNGDVILTSSDIQELVYVFENLVIGQTYYMKVVAYDNHNYQIFSSSDVLQLMFEASPMIENLAIEANPDLSIGLTGTLFPFGRDLTYHVAYGQDRNNLNQRTETISVASDSTSVFIDELITDRERFSTLYASVVIESEGHDPVRTDTLSARLLIPTFAFGTPTTMQNGNVSVPITIDNGGYDMSVLLEYGSSATNATMVEGSNEPVLVTIQVPNPGIGVLIHMQAVADIDGLISRSDTLSYTTNAPEFTFLRAFARQDYKAVFDASVNPKGIATQIRFEWGAFGGFDRVSPTIDLGSGTTVIDTTFISDQNLFFNADYVARMVIFGDGFEFISDTFHFNARIPGIGINDIQVVHSDTVVVSVQINSQGIDTYSRLAYGPVGSGFPDTTAAVARPTESNMQYFDMFLTGLASATQYEVKLLVQDQADLNKISVTNTSTFTTPVGTNINFQQVAGTAIQFDASAARLEFTNTAATTTFASYTIQMWFKTDDATRAVQFLTSKGNEFLEVHLSGNNQSLRFITRPGKYFDTPTNSIQSDVWTHLSATVDVENNLAKVYLNGIDMPLTSLGYNSGVPFSGSFSTGTNLNIGRRSDNSFYFGGEIDEIRLWNTSRTQLQVWDDMHSTTPSELDASLVIYAQLNEGTGSSLTDAANGIVGNLHGFVSNQGWVPSTIPINENAVYSTSLTGQAGWRLLSSPVETTVGELLANIWTQGFTGATTTNGSPNVYTWNASATDNSASNWITATSASQAVAPGEGVFVYVYATDPYGQGSFPKTISVTGNGIWGASALTSRLNPNPDGWALVGNPYSTDIVWSDLSRSGMYNVPYLWDANSEEWITWNGSTGALAGGRIGAFNAFFVATMSENPSLTAPFSARRAGTNQFVGKVVQTQDASTFSLKIESPDGRSNRAWFSFDANGKLGLDEFDAFKLAPYSQEYVQLSSVIQDSIRLDINHLPILTDELSIPLRIKSTASGTYRLSLNGHALPSGWDFAIIDTETGRMSRLDDALEFTWTGAGAESSRFVLKISPNTITHVEPIAEMPLVFGLDQNYPNPFNPSTVIGYQISEIGRTRLTIYDVLGREVAVLVDGVMPAGRHSVTFDGKDLASGMYIYRLQSGDKVLSRKFTLIK